MNTWYKHAPLPIYLKRSNYTAASKKQTGDRSNTTNTPGSEDLGRVCEGPRVSRRYPHPDARHLFPRPFPYSRAPYRRLFCCNRQKERNKGKTQQKKKLGNGHTNRRSTRGPPSYCPHFLASSQPRDSPKHRNEITANLDRVEKRPVPPPPPSTTTSLPVSYTHLTLPTICSV